MRLTHRRILAVLLLATVGGVATLRLWGVREIHPCNDSAALKLVELQPASDDWPSWRGTNAKNLGSASVAPLEWTASNNVLWQAAIPGRGHSSPIAWGSRIFLTTSDTADQTVSLICLERDRGNVQWQTEMHRGGFMSIHEKNSHASATPACDGRHVYSAIAINNAIWLTAVEMDGRIVWQKELGSYITTDGFGASPALHKGLVIVAGDNSGRGISRVVGSSFLVAVNGQTGEVVWRVKRSQTDSHATPLVAHVAGRDQLVLPGKHFVTSYDPSTGNELWTCQWGAHRPASTVTFDDQNVFASAKYPTAETVCIRANGQGDVTQTHVIWRVSSSAGDVPSPIVFDGRLYSASDNGVLTCLDAATGKTLWKRRLGGNISSSPLIVGGHLYCCTEEGKTFILKLDGTGEIVAENTLDDGIFASPTPIGDQLLLRTTSNLFCVRTGIAPVLARQPDDSLRQ